MNVVLHELDTFIVELSEGGIKYARFADDITLGTLANKDTFALGVVQ